MRFEKQCLHRVLSVWPKRAFCPMGFFSVADHTTKGVMQPCGICITLATVDKYMWAANSNVPQPEYHDESTIPSSNTRRKFNCTTLNKPSASAARNKEQTRDSARPITASNDCGPVGHQCGDEDMELRMINAPSSRSQRNSSSTSLNLSAIRTCTEIGMVHNLLQSATWAKMATDSELDFKRKK